MAYPGSEFEHVNDEQLQDLWFEYTKRGNQDKDYALVETEMVRRKLLGQA
jgi:hypothetical protein